ncbi:MAG TPA: urease accessory protein UreE [Advenella kashmirensis]|uniref:Urease accessory protein UreE n=2 Tax=Advenella TaxID=290425 RepID=A0A356LHX0_9BURK|nr:urease accessory protein UreE [Advenella kashmirensis]
MTRTVQKFLRHSGLSATLLQRAPVVRMTFEQRRRSRQQLTLDNGETIHLIIARGQVLLPGDVLVADDGGIIAVQAQPEKLIRVKADAAIDLTRAAYHLGNRHVMLEVGADYLHLEYDSVLVQMLHRLGVHTSLVEQPFNPETGAYGGGHKHGHDETFEEDYSLAQAAYHAHETGSASSHDHRHMHATDNRSDHAHPLQRNQGHAHGSMHDAVPSRGNHDCDELSALKRSLSLTHGHPHK